jgi:hypothetical protein
MSECERFRAQLEWLLSLPSTAWPQGLAAHGSACEKCARALAAARLARGLLLTAARGEEPPPGFAARVMAAVRLEAGRPEEAAHLWRPAWALLPAFGGVSAVLLVLLLRGATFPGSEAGGVGARVILDQGLSPSERFVLSSGPPDLDELLAMVLQGNGR